MKCPKCGYANDFVGKCPFHQKPCSICGGTGQDDPVPGKYHGLCKRCNGTGKEPRPASEVKEGKP
jgi:hypothetical protein